MLLTINTFIATDQEAIALTIKITPMMMKFFNPYTFILLGMFALSGYAQEARNQYRNELLQEEKEHLLQNEKEALKQRIKDINDRLLHQEITAEEADRLKLEYAEESARKIEAQYLAKENELYEGATKSETENTFSQPKETVKAYRFEKIRYKGWSNDLVFALGFNQLLEENVPFEDSRFDFAKSWFVEVGWSWKANLIPNSSLINLRYGVSLQVNSLSPRDQQVFYVNNDQVDLRPYDSELKANKLIYSNLIFPLHLELGSKKGWFVHRHSDSRTSYIKNYRRNGLVLGGVVFGGFNIHSIQKLKTDLGKEKYDPELDFSKLVYGFSAYVALPHVMTLYGKIDLSQLFENQAHLQHNVSLGLRLGIN